MDESEKIIYSIRDSTEGLLPVTRLVSEEDLISLHMIEMLLLKLARIYNPKFYGLVSEEE